MDVPTLPILWARDTHVLKEYDKWRNDALRSGKSPKEIRSEYFNGVRQRLGRVFALHNEAFVNEEGEPNDLLQVGDVFDAKPLVPDDKKKLLTIEARLVREDGKELRKPMRFNVYHYLVPEGLLQAGKVGFELNSPHYRRFQVLLLGEVKDGNEGAGDVLALFGDRSTHTEYTQTIYLKVVTSSPLPADEPRVPLSQMSYGLTTLGKLLSHEFLTAKTELLPDGDFKLVPSEQLSQTMLDYYEGNEFTDACVYDAVVQGLKDSWDKHYKKNSDKLTHKLIRLELGKSVNDGWKLKLIDLERFFANPDRKLSCVILDIWGNVVWKRVWEDYSKNISPRTLYLMAHNEHVWRINTEAQSLANTGIRDQAITEDIPTLPTPKTTYQVLPELNDKWKLWKLCDNWNDVKTEFRQLGEYVDEWKKEQEEQKTLKNEEEDSDDERRSHKKQKKPTFTIHYSGNMEVLFTHFYNDKDYECDVVVRDNHVVELRLNLEAKVRILTFSVEGEPCLVRKPRASKPTTTITDEEDYTKFLPLMANVKKSFIHRQWISHYSSGLQRAFDQLGRGQLVRNFVEGEHTGVGIDIRSFYPSLLMDIEELPVFSYMSDFQLYVKGTPVNNHYFYIVENRSDDPETFIVLNKRFNLVSGWTLNNCELPPYHYKLRAFVSPVSLVENNFSFCVDQVAKGLGDPLTNTSKFILNALIGLTGKRKAQNMNGKWTTNWSEAHARVKDPREIYPFADGWIAVQRSQEVMLENGFFPAQFLVYDRARVALLKLFRLLQKAGSVVYGVKTDCFIVDKVPEDLSLVEGRLVANMGKYHVEQKPQIANYAVMFVSNNEDANPRSILYIQSCREPEDCEIAEHFALRPQELAKPDFKGNLPLPICVFPEFTYRELTTTHTFNNKELVCVEDGTMVLGACAGSGKTTCCSASCFGKTLIVVPTNKRVDEFETEWLNTLAARKGERIHTSAFPEAVTDVVVMTNAQFLGRRISEENGETKEEKNKNERVISGYDTLFIDEFFQGSSWDIIAMVRRILSLRAEEMVKNEDDMLLYFLTLSTIFQKEREMNSPYAIDSDRPERQKELDALQVELKALRAKVFPKRTKVFANGDTFQLTNHESWNMIGDKQKFCDTFLWRVFPKRVFLKENFRLLDKSERPVLMNILKQLKQGRRKDEETEEYMESMKGFILRILKDNGLEKQLFPDPDFVLEKGKPMPCIAWSNVYGNAINQRFGGEDRVGMEVVCRAYMMTTKKNDSGKEVKTGLRSNKVYEVLDIQNNCYAIREDNETKFYPRIKFRRNIAQTAHAVQGETIKQNFAIFDWDINDDWRWVYVALSRARYLNEAWFYNGEPLVKRMELKNVIKKKLDSYRTQDEEAERSTDNFVTEKWVVETLKKQNYCCAEQQCMRPMLMEWDVDDKEEFDQQFTIDRKNNELGHVLYNCRLTCFRCNKTYAYEGK
jgi:hypothetical protein